MAEVRSRIGGFVNPQLTIGSYRPHERAFPPVGNVNWGLRQKRASACPQKSRAMSAPPVKLLTGEGEGVLQPEDYLRAPLASSGRIASWVSQNKTVIVLFRIARQHRRTLGK